MRADVQIPLMFAFGWAAWFVISRMREIVDYLSSWFSELEKELNSIARRTGRVYLSRQSTSECKDKAEKYFARVREMARKGEIE